MTAFLALLLFGPQEGMQVVNPVPLEPAGGVVAKQLITFTADNWICQIMVLEPAELNELLLAGGVSESTLKDDRIRRLLAGFIPFRIAFKNLGSEVLMFRPGQVMLQGQGLAGTQVDATDFFSGVLPLADPGLKVLADQFHKHSFEVGPGDIETRLISFRPLDHKFPKKVTFILNRFYYGIESTTIKCQFEVRYPKK